MNHQHEDLKHLLGRAFAGEPPLRLDRDEVFKRGRRRVRHRRIIEAGAVVAAVVAIVVGAASLTGLLGTGTDGELPPAATATTSTTGTTNAADRPTAASSSPVPTTVSLPTEPLTTDVHAARLTEVLAAGFPLPAGMVALPVPGDRTGPLTFRQSQGGYKAAADLTDRRGEGSLFIEVDFATARQPGCDGSPQGVSCTVEMYQGVSMSVVTQTNPDGEISYSINAVRPDGTGVYVAASNVSDRYRLAGKRVSSAKTPLVDQAVLKSIAALPGLTFS